MANFMSESGVMEFFIFGSSRNNGGPTYILEKLATLTGYQSMPPLFALGFHYSKWEDISTQFLIDKIEKFNENQLPLDVLWLDIEHTRERRYFTFNKNFNDIERLDKKATDD